MSNTTMSFFARTLLVIVLIGLYFPVLAEGQRTIDFSVGAVENKEAVIRGVLGFLKPFGAAVVVIFFLYGGFQMMTSGGDPKKYGDGRKTLLWAAVGFAILVLAETIVGAVEELLK